MSLSDRHPDEVIQRAYDDGYLDGKQDIAARHAQDVRDLKESLAWAHAHLGGMETVANDLYTEIASLKDQVEYWKNLHASESARFNELLALQISQADDAVDEAYKEGYANGWDFGHAEGFETGLNDERCF